MLFRSGEVVDDVVAGTVELGSQQLLSHGHAHDVSQPLRWSNQTLATIALWAAVKYLANRGKNYWVALIPAMFMTVVVTSYILAAPEGFVRFFGDKDIKVIEHIAIIIGCVVSLGCTAGFFMTNKKSNLITE